MAGKRILLVEPGYKNKYPPLGLMKIAQYHGPNGKRDHVRFIKGEDRSVLASAWDRIYVTTLFSFEYPKTAETIDFALQVANGQADKVFVGGIAASLMHERFLSERRWHGIRFIKGLLSGPPAVALQLDDFSEELYSDDVAGRAIEDLIPDYSILDHVDYRYPVRDAYFGLHVSRLHPEVPLLRRAQARGWAARHGVPDGRRTRHRAALRSEEGPHPDG